MKTNVNIHTSVKQYILIGIIVMITLFGLTLKAHAQSSSIAQVLNKINNAMIVKSIAHDFDIIIPKITREELNSFEDVFFNQMVYNR